MYPDVRGVAPPAANSNIRYTFEAISRWSSDFDELHDRMSTFDDIPYTVVPQDPELSSVDDRSIELEIASDIYGIMARQPAAAGFRLADRGTRARPAAETIKFFSKICDLWWKEMTFVSYRTLTSGI